MPKVLVLGGFFVKISRPLAHILLDKITIALFLLDQDDVEGTKRALKAMSKLIHDQTVETVDNSEAGVKRPTLETKREKK
jgi:hypothetical protein